MIVPHRLRSTILITSLVLGASLCARAQEMLKLPRLTVAQVQPAADAGDPQACYILGAIYFNGTGGRPNYAQASTWMTAAADQGLAHAQLALAEMYYDGTKVVQNDQLAFKWYQYAALQGMLWAELGMGLLYEEGRGVFPNPSEATRWYKLAAQHGHVSAMQRLGMRYYQGTGVAKDILQSYVWLTIAAANGMQSAVTSRDDLRTHLTRGLIDEGQRRAAAYAPTAHANAGSIAAEIQQIQARAKELAEPPEKSN
jgi:TPR repeat protein